MSVAVVPAPPARLPVVMPRTRAGCVELPPPCGFTLCRYHLAPDRRAPVPPGGPTCTLDLAAREGMTLDEIGRALGVSRERVRQIERGAIRRLAAKLRRRGLITVDQAARLPEAVRMLLRRGLVE